MTTLLVAVLIGLVASAWVYAKATRSTSRSRLNALFGVSDRLVPMGSDMGQHHGLEPVLLHGDGLGGKPDALFGNRKELVVGEYKHRHYRSTVRERELYQLMLYIGVCRRMYPGKHVTGVLCYRDKRIRYEFNPELYRWLLDQKPSFRAAERHLSRGR